MTTKKHLSPTDVQELSDMYRSGKAIGALAEWFYLSRQQIRRILIREGAYKSTKPIPVKKPVVFKMNNNTIRTVRSQTTAPVIPLGTFSAWNEFSESMLVRLEKWGYKGKWRALRDFAVWFSANVFENKIKVHHPKFK